MDFDLNMLTEAMKRKTSRVIELKGKCEVEKYKYTRVGMICILPLIYIVLFSDRIFNYLLYIFGENIKVDSITAMFDGAIVLVFIAGSFLFYLFYTDYLRIKRQFESIRGDIASHVEAGVCNCTRKCSCDDEYVKYMENHGIDVVFK